MEKRQRRSYGTLGEPDSDTDTDSEDSDSSVNAKKLPSIAPPAPPTPVPSAPVPVPPRSVSWKKGSIIYGLDLAADPFPTKPSFLLQVLLLVLIGVRPKHLAHRLASEDPFAVWKEFRVNSNVKRWASLSVLSGLMLAATGTIIQQSVTLQSQTSNPLLQIPSTIALGGRCAALTAAAFGTGLSLVFADSSPKDFARLAQTPLHMALVLGGPAFFSITAMFLFYVAMLADAWVAGPMSAEVVTTAFGGFILIMLLYACWLAFDITTFPEAHPPTNSAQVKEPRYF